MPRRPILITGCSAGGKSTLLAEMARRGWATVAEPGRRVIAESGVTPWVDPRLFAHLCWRMARADWLAAGPGITLFDRGMIDALLFRRHLGAPPARIERLLRACPYDPVVIVAPPWPGLFVPDAERRHDMHAALREYRDIAQALPMLGYRPRELPRAPVAERADWLELQLRKV